MRMISTHDAGIRLHRKRLNPASLKNAHIGIVHFLVTNQGSLVSGIEAISILHNKFARPHEAKTGANFISKLCLHLIKIDGQLPVGIKFYGSHGSDNLLVRGPQ